LGIGNKYGKGMLWGLHGDPEDKCPHPGPTNSKTGQRAFLQGQKLAKKNGEGTNRAKRNNHKDPLSRVCTPKEVIG